jgi:hypothetical protein
VDRLIQPTCQPADENKIVLKVETVPELNVSIPAKSCANLRKAHLDRRCRFDFAQSRDALHQVGRILIPVQDDLDTLYTQVMIASVFKAFINEETWGRDERASRRTL